MISSSAAGQNSAGQQKHRACDECRMLEPLNPLARLAGSQLPQESGNSPARRNQMAAAAADARISLASTQYFEGPYMRSAYYQNLQRLLSLL
jgi:hypothetical protein